MAQENDVVLVYFEDNPVAFARIEDIFPDYKKDWYHVKLLMLQLPLQTVTWILRDRYINGEEFTMSGKRMRIELVKPVDEPDISDNDYDEEDNPPIPEETKQTGKAKVISFKGRFNKKE